MKLFSSQSADGRRLFAPWAAARPRDRHTRASLGVVDLEARPGPAAAHRHRGRPPVSSTQVEQGVLMIGSACLLEARPGPAAAWLVLLGRAAVCAGGRRPAREIATRELRSEWSISKPGQALPPPTGTAARPRRPRGAPDRSGLSFVC